MADRGQLTGMCMRKRVPHSSFTLMNFTMGLPLAVYRAEPAAARALPALEGRAAGRTRRSGKPCSTSGQHAVAATRCAIPPAICLASSRRRSAGNSVRGPGKTMPAPCPVRHPLCQRPPVRRLHKLTSRACARCWSSHDGGTSRDPQGMVATGSLPIDTHRPQKRLPDACLRIRF